MEETILKKTLFLMPEQSILGMSEHGKYGTEHGFLTEFFYVEYLLRSTNCFLCFVHYMFSFYLPVS